MKPNSSVLRLLPSMAVLVLLSFLVGCAGMEYAPKGNGKFMFYHRELPAAEKAVEAARQAGKDRECPDEFRAAEKMKERCVRDVRRVPYQRGNRHGYSGGKHGECALPAESGCSPAPGARRISLGEPGHDRPGPVHDTDVVVGECLQRRDRPGNRQRGSQRVPADLPRRARRGIRSPRQATGGSRTAATTVAVNPPPPAAVAPPPPPPAPAPIVAPPPAAAAAAPKVIDRLDHACQLRLRQVGGAEGGRRRACRRRSISSRSIRGYQVSIEGHTDSIGTDKYNQALSERRAAAVKAYLVKPGVANDQQVKSVGYGESKPIADNKTKEGRFENRRVEILILSE